MKRSILILGLLTVLVSAALLVAGCSGSSSPSSTAQTASSNAPASQPTTNAPTSTAIQSSNAPASSSKPVSDAALNDIFKKAAALPTVRYDSVISTPGAPTTTQKVWMKKTKMRVETSGQGSNSVMLIDSEKRTMYNYQPNQNTATKMDFSQAPTSVTQDASTIQKYNPQVIGTETLEGKLCTVIQFTNEMGTVKEWLWQEKGLPLRVEAMTMVGKAVMEMKNIDFSDIPDSMFELPTGVQIIEMGQMNIPTNMPTNIPTNFPTDFPTNIPIPR
jgi:outer membrane lipoprotein-sorting protein